MTQRGQRDGNAPSRPLAPEAEQGALPWSAALGRGCGTGKGEGCPLDGEGHRNQPWPQQPLLSLPCWQVT